MKKVILVLTSIIILISCSMIEPEITSTQKSKSKVDETNIIVELKRIEWFLDDKGYSMKIYKAESISLT